MFVVPLNLAIKPIGTSGAKLMTDLGVKSIKKALYRVDLLPSEVYLLRNATNLPYEKSKCLFGLYANLIEFETDMGLHLSCHIFTSKAILVKERIVYFAQKSLLFLSKIVRSIPK